MVCPPVGKDSVVAQSGIANDTIKHKHSKAIGSKTVSSKASSWYTGTAVVIT
jgi:hypothetical protein